MLLRSLQLSLPAQLAQLALHCAALLACAACAACAVRSRNLQQAYSISDVVERCVVLHRLAKMQRYAGAPQKRPSAAMAGSKPLAAGGQKAARLLYNPFQQCVVGSLVIYSRRVNGRDGSARMGLFEAVVVKTASDRVEGDQDVIKLSGNIDGQPATWWEPTSNVYDIVTPPAGAAAAGLPSGTCVPLPFMGAFVPLPYMGAFVPLPFKARLRLRCQRGMPCHDLNSTIALNLNWAASRYSFHGSGWIRAEPLKWVQIPRLATTTKTKWFCSLTKLCLEGSYSVSFEWGNGTQDFLMFPLFHVPPHEETLLFFVELRIFSCFPCSMFPPMRNLMFHVPPFMFHVSPLRNMRNMRKAKLSKAKES